MTRPAELKDTMPHLSPGPGDHNSERRVDVSVHRPPVLWIQESCFVSVHVHMLHQCVIEERHLIGDLKVLYV
jgi:hypothetical protein